MTPDTVMTLPPASDSLALPEAGKRLRNETSGRRFPSDNSKAVRYADQPVSLASRLVGLGGTSAIGLAILAGLFLTWQSRSAPLPAATLTAVNVAPAAAPPEPVREAAVGPEHVQEDKPPAKPQTPVNETPPITIPMANIAAAMQPAKPVAPDLGAPVKETTAPVSKPVPAPDVSGGKPTWQGRVLAALDKVKRYPRDAHFARQQGVPYIRFTMDRRGKVLSVTLERSSGFRSLDQEALSLPKRAQPLPAPPDDVTGEAIELVVPVEFFMR